MYDECHLDCLYLLALQGGCWITGSLLAVHLIVSADEMHVLPILRVAQAPFHLNAGLDVILYILPAFLDLIITQLSQLLTIRKTRSSGHQLLIIGLPTVELLRADWPHA